MLNYAQWGCLVLPLRQKKLSIPAEYLLVWECLLVDFWVTEGGSHRAEWGLSVRINRSCNHITNDYMMTASKGNSFRLTGPLCGEFTGHR